MTGLFVLAIIWLSLWIIHGCTVEKLLKEILAETKNQKERCEPKPSKRLKDQVCGNDYKKE